MPCEWHVKKAYLNIFYKGKLFKNSISKVFITFICVVYAFSQYIKRSGPRLEPCETLLSFQTAASSGYKFYEANLFCIGSLLFIHHRHANSLHIQYCLKYNNIINNTISFLYVLISSPSSSHLLNLLLWIKFLMFPIFFISVHKNDYPLVCTQRYI